MNKNNSDYQRMIRLIEQEEKDSDYAYHQDFYNYCLSKQPINEEDFERWCKELDVHIEQKIRDYSYNDSLI